MSWEKNKFVLKKEFLSKKTPNHMGIFLKEIIAKPELQTPNQVTIGCRIMN